MSGPEIRAARGRPRPWQERALAQTLMPPRAGKISRASEATPVAHRALSDALLGGIGHAIGQVPDDNSGHLRSFARQGRP